MQVIAQRYIVKEKLGQGGMGMVHRAYDRLTGDDVALKQLLLETKRLEFSSRDGLTDERRALAEEFSTLAKLNHPHIVSVLDYGFDDERQPFYTMTLIEGGQTLLKATQGLPLPQKFEYGLQILRALIYLHRRKVLHRDLKPMNIMVRDGKVKLLDFGLAGICASESSSSKNKHGVFGTVKYMAPELFAGSASTESSELWAFGVILYELLAERSPFDDRNLAVQLNAIMHQIPDFMNLPLERPVLTILEKLLQKEVQDRYQSANEVFTDFQKALHLHTHESEGERANFLHTAKFVGRKVELDTLQTALESAAHGEGSLWLVGGKSGVGKSRLLNELRIYALVNGLIVVQASGLSNRGLSYQIWRDILPRLILGIELHNTEVSVLRELIPYIGALLKREVPMLPPLEGQAAQDRLVLVIRHVLERQPHPVLVMFEDLQGGKDSLTLVQGLQSSIDQLRLLIVGSYRYDEYPTLTDELPDAQFLLLPSLQAEALAEVSQSILGRVSLQPQILELIARETEGNTFLMLELMQALVEEAGTPEQIGDKTIPIAIFVKGMRQILQRHLAVIPVEYRSLLELAAVAGQLLDLDLLHALAPEIDLDNWLYQGQMAAILEIQDNRWQFTHDKLREAVLADVDYDSSLYQHLYQQVTEGMDLLYR